jgi:hypothetical protein
MRYPGKSLASWPFAVSRPCQEQHPRGDHLTSAREEAATLVRESLPVWLIGALGTTTHADPFHL